MNPQHPVVASSENRLQPMKALGDAALDSKRRISRQPVIIVGIKLVAPQNPGKMLTKRCGPGPRSSRYMNAPAHSPKQLRYATYLAAALVACYCRPAPPVESIRSPVCEQTELATSSRYLPLAIGGTRSPILEE